MNESEQAPQPQDAAPAEATPDVGLDPSDPRYDDAVGFVAKTRAYAAERQLTPAELTKSQEIYDRIFADEKLDANSSIDWWRAGAKAIDEVVKGRAAPAKNWLLADDWEYAAEKERRATEKLTKQLENGQRPKVPGPISSKDWSGATDEEIAAELAASRGRRERREINKY